MPLQPNTPVFSWSQLGAFAEFVISRGGANDVSSGAYVSTDVNIDGRYARQYSKDLPDVPGRTISFFASGAVCGLYGTPEYVSYVVLAGCPWGSAAERDVTYFRLAEAGVITNDMRRDSVLMALIPASVVQR